MERDLEKEQKEIEREMEIEKGKEVVRIEKMKREDGKKIQSEKIWMDEESFKDIEVDYDERG